MSSRDANQALADMPLPDPMKADDKDTFSLDDDKPLVCSRDQAGDKPCESCQ